MKPLETNRVIAYNLRRARLLRGLNQPQVAELLEPHIGKRLSRATISAAEKSFTAPPARVRRFSAEDLVVYCKVFDVPLEWFFIPPATSQAPNGEEPNPDLLDLQNISKISLTLRMAELSKLDPAATDGMMARSPDHLNVVPDIDKVAPDLYRDVP